MDDRLESILRNSDCFLAGTVAITTNIVFNNRSFTQIFLQDALFKNLFFSLILTIHYLFLFQQRQSKCKG